MLTQMKKDLKKKKMNLIEIDSKYYDTEKQSNEDLNKSKNKLKNEIENIKNLVSSKQNDEAINALSNFE